LQRVVVGGDLVGCLGIGLVVELDEDGIDVLVVASSVVDLGCLGEGNQTLQLGSAPLDGVDLLSDKTKQTEAVMRALLIRDVSRSDVASLGIARRDSLLGAIATLLSGLDALFVDGLEQLDFGLLELHGNLVALLDQLVKLLGISSNPHILYGAAEELTDAGFVEELFGDAGEENGARGHALSVLGVEQKGLAQVDVEDALAGDHVHDEAVDDPADECVCVEAVPLEGVADLDVAVGDDLELFLAIAASSVDGEEDWPSDTSADKCHDGAHSEISQEEVGVEAMMLEGVDIGDLPERADPVEPATGEFGASLLLAERTEVCSGCIESSMRASGGIEVSTIHLLRGNIIASRK
jgi:hypothetical protein